MENKAFTRIVIRSEKTVENIRYLCGVEPPEQAVLIKSGSHSKLIVSKMEYNRLRRTVKPGVTVVHPEKIGSSWAAGPADWAQKTVTEKKLIVSPDFPIGVAGKLEEIGFELVVTDEKICPGREVKNEQEIEAVQQSQRAAVAAMKAAIEHISSAEIGADGFLRVGGTVLTSEAVRATIGHTLLDFGCSGEDTIVSCGPASADPHERGFGPLSGGQPIVMDIFPRSGTTGYWGDITRTVCRGAAPVELKKQYNAVKAVQAAQLKKVKAGVCADLVHATGAELMESRGFKTEVVDDIPQGFIHGTGHGVGLEIHEAPNVSPANHQKLRAGHIVTVEPGLYYPAIGGVRIEDTVVVTKDGCKMLCPCIKKLEI